MLGISRMNSVGFYIYGEGKHRAILAIVCRLCDHAAKWPQRRRVRPRSLAAFQRTPRGPWPRGRQQTGPKALAAPASPRRPWPGAGLARNAAIRAHGDQVDWRKGRRRPRQLLGGTGKSQLWTARQRPRREPSGPQQAPPECPRKSAVPQPGPACPGVLRVLRLASNSASRSQGPGAPSPVPRLLADSALGRRVAYGSFFTQNLGR